MPLIQRFARPRVRATVRLNLPLHPMHRGAWYEDALIQLFKREAPGNRLTGAGTLLDQGGRPVRAELELALREPVDEQLAAVVEALEARAAPKGSSISLLGRPSIPFGRCSVLAVHLPAAAPPDVLYEHVPGNESAMAFMERLRDAANADEADFVVQTWWSDDVATTVYVSTTEVDRCSDAVQRILNSDPLAPGSSIETRID